ncbi:MAG TPA: hypothetical protein VEB59_10520 [Gemmatimonadales bacterium]|nr:hypothetical protein [Gemmatimonadales bacterium]
MKRTRIGHVVRARLLEHFELFLTTIGVIITVLLLFAELTRGEEGIAFISIVWLQGFLLWAVHRHAWFRQRALVQKMRVMLQDRVNNQLTIMLGAAEAKGREFSRDEEQDLQTALLAARTVSSELENLSLESLRVWERRYGRGMRALI